MNNIEQTLYLHVGLHQTDVSNLQAFFGANRKYIHAQFGLYYPLTGSVPVLDEPLLLQILQHSNLKPAIMHRQLFPPHDDTWAQLAEEVSRQGPCNILVSDENIAAAFKRIRSEDWMAIIRSHFPSHTVKIILYLGRLDERFKSFYLQQIMFYHNYGYCAYNIDSYEDFLADCHKNHPQQLFLSRYIEFFSEIVGKENVITRINDSKFLKNGNIIDDFCDILRIDSSNMSHDFGSKPLIPPQAATLLSRKLLPPGVKKDLRGELYLKVRKAYLQDVMLPLDIIDDFKEEIEKIDRYIPGYKELFIDQQCFLPLPEGRIDPVTRLSCELLYSIFANTTQQTDGIKHLHNSIVDRTDKISTAIEGTENKITQQLSEIMKFQHSIIDRISKLRDDVEHIKNNNAKQADEIKQLHQRSE